MSLTVKTILREVQDFGPCTIRSTKLKAGSRPCIEVHLECSRRRRAHCSSCGEAAPRYDRQPERRWQYLFILNFIVYFLYAPWRVKCPRCGVKIERIPWSAGKSPYSLPLMHFLARWARRLSWKETAAIFRVSWECVRGSVEWLVQWGLEHRNLSGVTALGVDEIHWGKGKGSDRYVTVLYQLDAGRRRLLWVGRKRTEKTLRGGLRELEAKHPGFCAGIAVICSDMWRPYLKVARIMLSQALNVLDPFHVARHLHDALDQVRRGEQSRMGAAARARTKGSRFLLLKRKAKVRGKARQRLNDALAALKETSKAWIFKEVFHHFWRYRSPAWASKWLREWIAKVRKSGIKPMIRVANMLESHHDLLMNYFRLKGEFSNAASEGMNNKMRISLAGGYGYRVFDVLKLVMYHKLGELPEPPLAHRFC